MAVYVIKPGFWCLTGLSDQKIKMGFIIRVEKLSFWELGSKIHDVVATPTIGPYFVYTQTFIELVYVTNAIKEKG